MEETSLTTERKGTWMTCENFGDFWAVLRHTQVQIQYFRMTHNMSCTTHYSF